MFAFHKDKQRYFQIQYMISRDHVLPFIETEKSVNKDLRVLEIGCAEAGVLKPFIEMGCSCVGVDFSEPRIINAKKFQKDAVESGQLRLFTQDIFEVDVQRDMGGLFDIIILKDVIEHLINQRAFLRDLGNLMRPGAVIFFAFPPWQMPFGGHQQNSRSGFFSKLAWVHLLPMFLYKPLVHYFEKEEAVRKEFIEIKRTGISMEKFESYCRFENFKVRKCTRFLFNPIYEHKFGIRPRILWPLVSWIPWIRNFYTTCAYYLISR